MYDNHKTRFKSSEDALRFFFRVRELLGGGHAGRLRHDELPTAVCRYAANVLDDYECIGWCMRGLDEVDLWLLGEIYGPTCFGERRRKLSFAFEVAQRDYPRCNLRLRQLGTLHRRSIDVVEMWLRELDLIPPAQTHDRRANGQRIHAARSRARLSGTHASRR
jgi:hypothetical protein